MMTQIHTSLAYLCNLELQIVGQNHTDGQAVRRFSLVCSTASILSADLKSVCRESTGRRVSMYSRLQLYTCHEFNNHFKIISVSLFGSFLVSFSMVVPIFGAIKVEIYN